MLPFKKNNSVLFLIILSILCVTSGCSKDWLDAKADKNMTVPESLIELQGMMDNYALMGYNLPYSGEVASDLHYMQDEAFATLPKSYETDAYRWVKEQRFTEVGDWNITYKKILVDNIVLDGLPSAPIVDATDEEQRAIIKGHALFHRSFIFFCLLQLYAPVYDAATASTDPGIPLRTTTDLNAPTIRNSVKEGYDLVIRELTEAAALLPDKAKNLTRPSKAAAHAMLSRVYLSMGDYENSLSSANTCLNMHSALLDYNDIPLSQMYIGRYNKEVIYHINYYPGYLMFYGLIDAQFYASYADHDLRKTRFYFENPDGTISFKGNYDNGGATYFQGLATDEMLLTKAECLARLGRTAEAMQTLNTLIKTRWDNTVPYPELAAGNPEEALATILEERKKEMIFRNTRWMDLRRLNKDPRFAVTLTRTVAGQTYTLEPNSYKYTFPIPDDIIEQTGMKQNTGWE